MSSLQTKVGAVYEEVQPNLELEETPEAHILQIHLPGFTREEVKIKYASSTNVLSISGEKSEGGNKWSRFSEAIPVPENCDVNRLRAQFDKGILTITMPRKFITPTIPKEELGKNEEEISQDSSLVAYEEFQPKVEKTENVDAYLLQVYLPGFSKDQLKIQYISSSRMIGISGERPIEGGKRWSRFDQILPVPEKFNEKRLGARFREGILTITVPKKDTMGEQKPQKVEEVIPPKSMEGIKRSSSLLNLEEIDQKPSVVYEEFHPKSEITEHLEAYRLQIYLPGETPIEGGNKWIRVDQAYPVPENYDPERVQGKFDKGILTITIPKKFFPQLLAPREEVKTTQEKVPSPLDKYTTHSLEEGRDMRLIASFPSHPQKAREELAQKPTRLTLHDEQAATRTANVEGKHVEDIVDMIGKGIQEVSASTSTAVTNIGYGTLNDEEKHLLAVLIAALGAYVSYRSTASGKPYNY